MRDDVRVDSFCHHCGTPITVELRDGHAARAEPEETLVYLKYVRTTESATRTATIARNVVSGLRSRMVIPASLRYRSGVP
ncbi:MAG: hypothetical protein H0W17_07970 [Chloroflexi bacterium]|nr:hypothetical protein [Chloroflexota bacterium]